jgi:poly(hydroxyalkanoate) depolymerase family esterase
VLLALVGPVSGAWASEPTWGGPADRHSGLGRDYLLYVPPTEVTETSAPRALVVYLHGCSQTALDAALGTRWNDLADAEDVVVAYPEQSAAANGATCWNWFLPEHQVRDSGEPAIIAAITREVIADDSLNIDPSRVYVIGASAGADMTTILGATYPDLYAAIAPFAGCAYLSCVDVSGSQAKAAMGDRVRPMPAMVAQGTADPLNNPALGETAVQQWVGTNGVSPIPTEVEDHPAGQGGGPGSGDLCARNAHFPCAGGATGWSSYPYTVHHHADASGCSLVDAIYVHGLSHDYPGGRPEQSFTDPIGPDATAMAWAFFSKHRVGAPCSA